MKESAIQKIIDFIEDNYPTEVKTDWEQACAYVLDEILKICRAEGSDNE